MKRNLTNEDAVDILRAGLILGALVFAVGVVLAFGYMVCETYWKGASS